MLQTVEAVIDTQGRVRLLEVVKLGKKRRALVTILDEEETPTIEKSIVGSIELLNEDLESGSRQIAEMFNQSLEKSAEDLKN
ncbi:MAG: hypothetical protein M3R14_05620 [Acidobacteriota bacterium]|nr:hypothetical protein [Acidobacteriota bacterium]